MDELKTLEEVLAKNNKGGDKGDRQMAVEALLSLYAKTCDATQVSKYLMGLHYLVSRGFLVNFSKTASEENMLAIVNALLSDDDFNTGNANNTLYPKGFSAVIALATNKKYTASFMFLNQILSRSDKKEGFTYGCLNRFKTMIADTKDFPIMLELYDHIMNNTNDVKEFEKQRFTRFMKSVEDMTVTISKGGTVSPTAQKSELLGQDNISVVTSTIKDEPVKEINRDDAIQLEALKNIEKSQHDILALLRIVADNNKTIESFAAVITQKEAELREARNAFSDKDRKVGLLDAEIAEKDKQIDDLTERLRTALQMDGISKNQEIATLKNDISEALKLDYSDFIKGKEKPFNEDLFDAYRATLSRTFKLLKRFGISCE